MPPKSKSVARHQACHKRVQVWWMPEEYELLISNAAYCGLTASEYIRRTALDKIIVPRTDTATLLSLMKLGGLQKKIITDLREDIAASADVSKLVARTNQVYDVILGTIKSISTSGEHK